MNEVLQNDLKILKEIFPKVSVDELKNNLLDAQKIIDNQALEKSTYNPYDFSSNINYSGYEGL